jgi:hypothetical protein
VDGGRHEAADVHDHEPDGLGSDGADIALGSTIVAGSQSTEPAAPAATTAAVAKNVLAGTSTS